MSSVRSLGHVNLRAGAEMIERLLCFYTDIIGLDEGPRPSSRSGSQGHWLYAGTTALVHLSIGDDGDTPLPTGHFNHVAFNCENLDTTRARLDAAGIAYTTNSVEATHQTQLFLVDPAGIKVELTFATP